MTSGDLVRVDQPLLLISQAQRSGGTLLLRLMDGHPQCHVAPFQLRGFDQAVKERPTEATEAWRMLYDSKLGERFLSGHRQRKHDVLDHDELFSFELPPDLQRAIFDACAAELSEPTTRELVDCYFTSYFNAWLDYGNLRTGPKRWVVGFEPGVSRSLRRSTSVLQVYPDGRVLTIVRDPWSWFASARRWEPRWQDREHALDHWCSAAQGTIRWRKKAGGRNRDVRTIRFEDLLTRTEETLRRLATWIGIEFRSELLQPTFNGQPIRANSSFSDVKLEISTKPLDRAREELDRDDAAYIEARAGDLYRELLVKAERDWERMEPAP